MEYLIGVFLALGVAIGASAIGFDRERSFYPTVLIVIAFLYALFAILGGSMQALLLEALPIALFVTAAVLGFKKTLWWDYWPGFCGTYDVVAGVYLAWILLRHPVSAKPSNLARPVQG